MARKRKPSEAEVKAAADRAEGTPPDCAEPAIMGRPTEYKPEYAGQVEKLCLLGATDIEIADFFGVHVATIYRWSFKYPEFCEAKKTGKETLDERVERSLFQRAVGYTFESEKIFQHQGEVVRAKTREHVPPSDTAMIFWLKNRRPDRWRDVHKHEVGGAGAFDGMSDDDLENFIRAEAEALNISGGSARETSARGKGKAMPPGRTH